MYDHVVLKSMSLATRFSDCVETGKAWMSSSRSCLNSCKTELICRSASRYVQLCPTGPLNIAGASTRPSQQVRDLGVVLDFELSLAAHVSHIILLRLFVTVRYGSYACCAGLFHSKQLMHSCVRLFTPASTIATPFLKMLHRCWWLPSSPFCALLLGLY